MNFVNLPVPAANGVGAAVEVGSFMAALKTIMVTGTMKGSVTIEASVDQGVTWGPVETFAAFPHQNTLKLVCSHMRARVSGFTSGVAEASVGGEEGQCLFFSLPVPAGNGNGAPVNTLLAEYIKTFVVAGTFVASLNVEISQDGTDWAPLATYTIPTTDEDVEVVNAFLRVRQSGYVSGTATITVGCSLPESPTATTASLPNNVNIFADAVNGNDINPGTAALPVKTFTRAMNLAPPQWTGQCNIHFAPGDYFTPTATIGSNGPKTQIGRPVGPDSYPMAWLGGFEPMPAVAPFVSPTTGTVLALTADGFTATAPGPSFFGIPLGTTMGFPILFSGGGRGYVKSVIGAAYTLYGPIPSFAATETFQILQPSAKINVAPGNEWMIAGRGPSLTGDLVTYGIMIQPTGGSNAFLTLTDLTILARGLALNSIVSGSIGSLTTNFFNSRLTARNTPAKNAYPFLPSLGNIDQEEGVVFRWLAGTGFNPGAFLREGSSFEMGNTNSTNCDFTVVDGIIDIEARSDVFLAGEACFMAIGIAPGSAPIIALGLDTFDLAQPGGLIEFTPSPGGQQVAFIAANGGFGGTTSTGIFAINGAKVLNNGLLNIAGGVGTTAFIALQRDCFCLMGRLFGSLTAPGAAAVVIRQLSRCEIITLGGGSGSTITTPASGGQCFVGENYYNFPITAGAPPVGQTIQDLGSIIQSS